MRSTFFLTAFALSATAAAQDLLVTRHAPARIEKYSVADGSLIDDRFVDVDALLGLGGANQFLWDVAVLPNGEILVSNYSAEAVHRFSADGASYLGDLGSNFGRSVGLGVEGSSVAGASLGSTAPGGAGVYVYDLGSQTQTQPYVGGNVWDVTPYQGGLLATSSTGLIEIVDPVTGNVTPWATGSGFYEQGVVLSDGGVLVADFSGQGFDEFDANGALVREVGSLGGGSIRGLAVLGDGNYLLSGSSGVSIYDDTTGIATMISTGSGAFVFGGAGGLISNNYCNASPNSTGLTGAMSGFGSSALAANDVTLVADQLPANATAFFLTSRMTGFVANPGGSEGNLCLGGMIGRYIGAGEVLNSGAAGRVELQIDLTRVPQPTGFVAVQAGETWNFQAWHRDLVGGAATSNFTDGLSVTFN